jgi:hypothetical protein
MRARGGGNDVEKAAIGKRGHGQHMDRKLPLGPSGTGVSPTLRCARRDQALQVSFGDGVEGMSRSAISLPFPMDSSLLLVFHHFCVVVAVETPPLNTLCRAPLDDVEQVAGEHDQARRLQGCYRHVAVACWILGMADGCSE